MIPTHLRKKDDIHKTYLYAYTDALAMQPDMIPCDKRGNPVGVAGEITGSGMRPREPEAPNAELTVALEAIVALKAELEALKGKNDPIAEPVKKPVVALRTAEEEAVVLSVSFKDMRNSLSRNALFDHLKERHGEKADYLKGNMSKNTLLEEAEKLQAAADLEDR